MHTSLQGKVALITAGGESIGLAAAKPMAPDGATVFTIGSPSRFGSMASGRYIYNLKRDSLKRPARPPYTAAEHSAQKSSYPLTQGAESN